MVYFTSDLHLGHSKVLPIRPMFHGDIEAHDEYLINMFNQRVRNKDEVYILGDLCFRSTKPVEYYLERLHGRKHLIVGNHDISWMEDVDDLSKWFETVDNLRVIKHEKKRLTLCHYPLLEWSGSRYPEAHTSFLIHGHLHNSRDRNSYGVIKEFLPHALNCGVDVNGYMPVTFDELLENCKRFYERVSESEETEQ